MIQTADIRRDYLSMKEAAIELGLSYHGVAYYINKGKLRVLEMPSGFRCVVRSDVLKLKRERKRRSLS